MLIQYEDLKKLLEIIPNYPKINIFHINNNSFESSQALYNFCKEKDYDYDLFSTYEYFIETLKEFNPKNLDIKSPRYNRHSKLYDFIFLTLDLDEIEDKKLFFKKIYHLSKNSAKILLFINHHDNNLEKILEDLNFVALNYIDISKNYHILSAQKMHGWGIYDT